MDQIGRKNATAKVEMCITDRFEHTAATARARVAITARTSTKT